MPPFPAKSQLYSDERVNQIRMGKQVLKTRPKKSQPFPEKTLITSIITKRQYSSQPFQYEVNISRKSQRIWAEKSTYQYGESL